MTMVAEERKMNNLNDFQKFDLKGFLHGKELELVTVNKASDFLNFLVEIVRDDSGCNEHKVITIKVPFLENEDSLPLEVFKGGQKLCFETIGEMLKASFNGAKITLIVKGILFIGENENFKFGQIEENFSVEKNVADAEKKIERKSEVKADRNLSQNKGENETVSEVIPDNKKQEKVVLNSNIQPPSVSKEVIEKTLKRQSKKSDKNKRKRRSRF